MPEREIAIASLVHCPASVVWSTSTTLEGLNRELSPYLYFVAPNGESLKRKKHRFRGWLLALGVLPFERFVSAIVTVDVGRKVVEEGSSLAFRSWRAERSTTDVGPARCKVVDQLRIATRFFLPAYFIDRLVLQVFVHRHRRLQQYFGGHFVDPADQNSA